MLSIQYHSAGQNNQNTHTVSLSSQNIDIVYFISNRIDRSDDTTTNNNKTIRLTTISFLVLVLGVKYFVSIDIIQKECHPPLSLSLYLRIHLSSIPSPMFAPLHLCHIVVLFIHFLVQYHQSQNVKSAVTLLAETTNHSLTHSLSWISIAFVLFLTQLIDSTTTRTTQIRRFHHQSMGGIINFIGLSVSLC